MSFDICNINIVFGERFCGFKLWVLLRCLNLDLNEKFVYWFIDRVNLD